MVNNEDSTLVSWEKLEKLGMERTHKFWKGMEDNNNLSRFGKGPAQTAKTRRFNTRFYSTSLALCWLLWEERNARIFTSCELPPSSIVVIEWVPCFSSLCLEHILTR